MAAKVWRHVSQVVQVPSDLRIAIISDTHGHAHANAQGCVREVRPHYILHAGDIGRVDVLDAFADLAPLSAVRGNIDGQISAYPDSVSVQFECKGETLLRVYLVHAALYGPHLRADARRRAQQERAQLVVCGHSHVPFLGVSNGITVFNPGSIGPPRPPLPITFGVLAFAGKSASLRHISCETGNEWLPPDDIGPTTQPK